MRNFEDILLKKSATIIETLVAIDRGGCKTAFLTDDNRRLYASVSDGDIRRALIQGEELSACAGCVANKNPLSVTRNYNVGMVKRMLQKNLINALPVVDEQGVVIDIVRINDLVFGPVKNPVVIMAGGLGKRLGQLCSETPKPMLRIAGEPILQHIIANLTRTGFVNIYISVNYKSEIIEDYFGDGSAFGCHIDYIREAKRLGTAGSIRLCEGLIDTEFMVVNGDILTRANLLDMLNHHNANNYDMTVGTVAHTVQVEYGVLEVDNGLVRALTEKPVMNYKINGGVYCLSPKLIELIPKNEYFEMTQFLDIPITVGSYEINDYWIDIGHLNQYETAENDFMKVFSA